MAEVRDRIYLMQLCLRFFFFFTKAVETFGMPYVRLRWRNAILCRFCNQTLRCQHFKTIASIFGISQQKLSQKNQPLDDIRLANLEPQNQTEILKRENGSRSRNPVCKIRVLTNDYQPYERRRLFGLLFSPVVAFLAATGNTSRSAFAGYNEL